jgi:ribosomal protein S18 acetylase RimI-like enzyme
MGAIATVPGLRLRPYAGEPDLADLVRIGNAEAAADGIERRVSIGQLMPSFANPGDHFDPARDVTVAELDGRPVAYQMRNWVDTTDGLREYRLDGGVEPAARRRGIGTALLQDGERRWRAHAAANPDERPQTFGSWAGDSQPGAAALFRGAGFAPARYFFDMSRTGLDDAVAAPLPDGLELRPITHDLALAVWRADVEAFKDHWGGFDGSDARLDEWLARPSTDLSLWIVAFDGEEVAGGIINTIDRDENEELGMRRGWLSSVFTRRAWRRRGLAQALITHSLVALRERGMTVASLGVDADNPSGALGVYERTGFEVTYRSTAWRKAFER